MLPPEGELEEGPRVRAVYTQYGRFVGFQDPDLGNVFLNRDEGLRRLRYDPEIGVVVDSFGEGVAVGAMKMPSGGYTFEFKYKSAEYIPWSAPPEEFQPRPGDTLQVRLVIIDPDGNVHVVYKSFGENQKWSAEVEAQMVGEAVSETRPGLLDVFFYSPPMSGIEMRKDYSVQRVSTRRVGE